MATQAQLRQYLSHWFQLGKGVKIAQDEASYCPSNIAYGSHYSPEFEAHWQKFQRAGLERCYLEDTGETLAELSQSDWDIQACARCDMPVALKVGGITPLDCPCSEQSNWPNLELPTPKPPQNWNERIRGIGQRLKEK